MGRWRGNKGRFRGNKKDASSTSKEVDISKMVWSWKEQKEVIQYLREYRKAAERVYQQDHGDSNSTTEHATNVDKDKAAPCVIGGVVFPALTDEAVSQAYLTLSKALSSKRRKAIHEMAVDGKYTSSCLSVPTLVSV
jgi:cell pole-organizing protein PopZ